MKNELFQSYQNFLLLTATLFFVGFFAGKDVLAATSKRGSCGDAPTLRKMLEGDAAKDASGSGQIFESIEIKGITDQVDGMAGVAVADFNRDGFLDILSVFDSQKLKLFLGNSCFSFTEYQINIIDSDITADALGRNPNVPNVVDLNGDGFLDILISVNRGQENNPTKGNRLLLSQGKFDTFTERAAQMDISNFEAYNRQTAFGDVNGDGWLDLAIGADNIGNARPGKPLNRLYIFQPNGKKFEDGKFTDIGGTPLVPNFGGEFSCNAAKDKAGPNIVLRDLDNDGDLDLIQTYHNDMSFTAGNAKCASGEYEYGVFVWRNLLKEKGNFQFEQVTNNGLAESGKSKFDAATRNYMVIRRAVGLPYIFFQDVNNDGMLDALAVGPTDPEWHVNSDRISGRFWHNLGKFKFQEATNKAGLDSLNWNYGQWTKFWDAPVTEKSSLLSQMACKFSPQPAACGNFAELDHQPYGAGIIWGDFNNDTHLDFVWVDRRESDIMWGKLRNMLYLNNGDGTFKLISTQISGIDSNSVTGEAADLNGDGLLDLVFAADPRNSYPWVQLGLDKPPDERFTSKVYWNTGEHGGKENNWLRIGFSGIPDQALVGAKIEVRDAKGKLLGFRAIFPNQGYKAGGALQAHFGLGKQKRVNIKVTLANGKIINLKNVNGYSYESDGSHSFKNLNLATGKISEIELPI